jgi:dolichol-phosphate mannosyltransferase
MKVSVVVPTYQERENIATLVTRTDQVLRGFDYEIVVVDDESPDGTGEAAKSLASEYAVRVIERKGERGLGSAILEGFRNAQGDVVVAMDADLQHPPEVIPQLVAAMQRGADIAVASRYAAGGQIREWSWPRRLVSWGATLLARPLTRVRDPMSGCFMLNHSVLEGARVTPDGYKLLLEILVKGRYRRVEEVPITFGVRQAGESKLGAAEYARYLRLLARLYAWRGQDWLRQALAGIIRRNHR